MGILSNSAFSRSLVIRWSDSFLSHELSYAAEIIVEHAAHVIRTSDDLKIKDVRFSLDKVSETSKSKIINASHILGYGLTLKLISLSEYSTLVKIYFCDDKLHRKEELERKLLNGILQSLGANFN